MTPTKPTLQRVLVPTDFSDAARSTYKVARDMTRDGGQIFLVHVAPAFPPHVEARDLEVYLEELEEALTQESCDAAFEGAEISTHLIQPGSLDIFERAHRIDLDRPLSDLTPKQRALEGRAPVGEAGDAGENGALHAGDPGNG